MNIIYHWADSLCLASGALVEIMEEFHMVTEVGVLTISLFVAGYCIGPLLWV